VGIEPTLLGTRV